MRERNNHTEIRIPVWIGIALFILIVVFTFVVLV
jgi:hypothetical protein